MPGEIPQCVLLLLDLGGGICTVDPRDRVFQISTADNGEMESQSKKKSILVP